MLLPPARVNQCRALVVWALRGVSVALAAAGAYFVVKRLLFGIGIGDLSMVFRTYMGLSEESSVYAGLSMIVVGAALGVAAPPLARWMVQVPADLCPRCSYQPGDRPACPECGLVLRPAEPPGRGG